MPDRYFFNLTDGNLVIRDEEGIEVTDLKAAATHAMEAIEGLLVEDPSNAEAWQGWRLEIVDSSGRMVQCIPLDASSAP